MRASRVGCLSAAVLAALCGAADASGGTPPSDLWQANLFVQESFPRQTRTNRQIGEINAAFGTGFGSFAYLKRVPSRYLKIDGEFVAPPRSQTDEVVIDSVVSLARALGKTTVAEHVEDEESFELIASAGVDLAQGYHFGPPLPVEEALARQYG